MSSVLLIILLFTSVCAQAQDAVGIQYAKQLDSSIMRASLTKLASDEFGGRGTNQPGGLMAVNFIVEQLRKYQVVGANKGSYLQRIAMKASTQQKKFLFDGYDFNTMYSYNNTPSEDTLIVADSFLFVGYGIQSATYNDFSGIDITDKMIVKIEGEPTNKYGTRYAMQHNTSLFLEEMKPKALIKINQNFEVFYTYSSGRIVYESDKKTDKIPEVSINELLANRLLESTGRTVKQIVQEIESTGRPITCTVKKPIQIRSNYKYEPVDVYNVLGMVEGGDLKEELVVVTAHHDHVGTRYNDVYNGADDNASGVAAVMEMARVMAKAKKEGKGPRRSILFLFTAAEEEGLYGSQYYANNPLFPLNKTVACVNLDMVGRIDDEYKDKGNDYVFLMNNHRGTDSLTIWLEEVNKNTMQLKTDYKYASDFNRSDQYSFSQKGVPSIGLTSGMHSDYHKTTDDIELIDFDGMLKRTKLSFLLLWKLANAAHGPVVSG